MQGCRCDKCRGDQAAYARKWRADHVNGPELVNVQEADGPGRNEAAVVAELARIPAAEDHPGVASAALELARVLDHPRAISSKPAAARNLADLLDRLRKGAGQRRTRLASVRQMSRGGGEAAAG